VTPMLTPEEVAEQTKLCPTTIRRLCARGTIRAKKLAGKWRIPQPAYEAWLESSEPEPGVIQPGSVRRHLRAVGGSGEW
jgi:excisionase family DNA binding protein